MQKHETEDIHFFLKKYWGHHSFRTLQEPIIRAVIEKKDCLALLPTGGGKSVCFQIPGLVIGGTCLVVSPLIALMTDQVQNLKKKGISAVAISSVMNAKEIDIALNNAAYGHVQFLYVSPERIANEDFRQKLAYLPIGLIAVDEAHCISQWGYDFRPSYLKIVELRQYFPSVHIIAVTASATEEVIADIQNKLQFKNQAVFKQSFERKNIRYVVQQEENKYARLLKIIKNIGGSGIVYVRNRKKTQEIASWLLQQNISASFYHAGINAADRTSIQQQWIENKQQVIVATNAFGMGIDKPDVRFVVHLDLPESLEAYFQEAGRAGRDEKPAYAIMLSNDNDVFNLREQFIKKTPSIEQIKQVYQAVFNYYQIAVESGEGLSITFDIEEVARNYNILATTIYNAIKCLEKEGYMSLLDAGYEPSKVMIKINKENLYSFQLKQVKYEPLIKTLLRSYGGLFEQYASIKEKEAAYRAKISEYELLQQLDYLNKQGVISYIPQTTLPQLVFLQNRINLKFEDIQLINYPILKRKGEARIESVCNYVNEDMVCRNRLLLTYFDERNTKDCHYCDVCVKKNKLRLAKEEPIKKELFTLLKQKPIPFESIINALNHFNAKDLSDVINQLIDDELLAVHSDNSIYVN